MIIYPIPNEQLQSKDLTISALNIWAFCPFNHEEVNAPVHKDKFLSIKNTSILQFVRFSDHPHNLS